MDSAPCSLALQGAYVIANVRSPSSEARALIGDLENAGLRARLSIGDIGNEERLHAQVHALSGQGVQLTGLVLNAYPAIRAARFSEMTEGEFEDEVLSGFRMTSRPIRRLLPVWSPAGWVLAISSAYVAQPKEGFSHYIASKAATESLLHVLSREYPQRKFWVCQAPRMLTDQTNVGLDVSPPETAPSVAVRLLERLGDPSSRPPGWERWTLAE